MSNIVLASWVVGDQTIFNQFDANRLAFKSNAPAYRFSFLEDFYKDLNWTSEPQQSWNELCVQRAMEIRQRYKKIKLMFSAGRDSGHVFRVFENAGLHIDELVLPYSPYHPHRNWEHHHVVKPIAEELCRRNPGMIMREICQDKSWYERIWKQDQWLTERSHQRCMMFTSYEWNDLIEQDLDFQSGTCGYINGLEKPRIKIIDGNYVCQFIDTTIQFSPIGVSNVEYFYWAPEMPTLFLKQAWMLVNHLESKYPGCTAEFVDTFQNTSSDYYDELCSVLGRGPAMAWKVGNGKNKISTNYAWAIQQVIKIAKQENWQCWKEYSLIIDDLQRNHAHHFNNNDPQCGSIGIVGQSYFMKTQETNHVTIC